ncbi:IclR family transcriptional regulator [Nocardia sp. NPDC059239]|uniref:IclR family transcriptional regulator n=1 Tax=unclassified Nocardia TaxID=2637762 RepID=UPI0036D0DBD1
MTISHTVPYARLSSPSRSGVHTPEIAGWDRPDRDSSTSVAKALALLSSFTPHHLTMGVTEIARRANLPKSTAHRLLSVLVEWEMITKRGTEYSPGGRLTELAALSAQPDTQDLRRVALPYLLDLYEMTHETVNLCVLVGDDVLYVDKIHGHNCVNSPALVGARLPAANTAVGKALLAFSETAVVDRVARNLRPATSSSISSPAQLARELAAIRRTGIAYDRQETRPGLSCIAAPVRSWSGTVVAAVSISGSVQRFQPATAATAIRTAAAGIAKRAQQASWQRHLSR